VGESVIKYSSPLNVLKDTYDHICYWARSDEYQHSITDSPTARLEVLGRLGPSVRALVGRGGSGDSSASRL
jgi:hypothetical protein